MSVKSIALAAVLAGGGITGCGGSPCGDTEGKVTRVLDGDTVELEDGRKIRYLLVDTPEVSGGGDCYGSNATTFNSDLVLNKTVELSYDVECTDNYGRTLAYVRVGNQEVNTLIIERGYGCVLHISPDGDSRVDEFLALQTQAKNSGAGLWGFCNPLPPACM